ncbi:conjugal transfer protein TraF [Marinobacter sp. X15-166B]|uniref:conjugal transfer protein TraF n=1 Tax=Marinobacter sp. X15-166B TaxID=1897620 RepID=UPI00085CA30D|nr:conjugal transfer protein TraF [Marinobacter sp. X15-166B]OEY65544.1 conjugal transfer protein TraF [Marinobacter sp. X15-166B]
MPAYTKVRLALAIGLSLTAASTLAAPQNFQTARSFAMGGTGVAVAHPASAAAANPAMMAATHHDWSDDFGLILPSIYVRAADEEETVDQIDDIQDTIDRFDSLAQSPANIAEARALAGELLTQLQQIDQDTVRVNAGAGLSIAVPSPTLSVGFFTNANLSATVRADFDENDEQRLTDIVNGTVAPENANLDNLESSGRVLASAVGEFGLAFARSIELNNGEQLQLGISPKFVQLRTFQYTETISTFDDDDFDAKENETSKSGFNIDIGAAYAFGDHKQWNAGAAVKNLIPMKLDSAYDVSRGERKHTLELKPKVTAGIAHQGNYHVVTAELDLTKQQGFGYADDTQWLALGAEFDAFRHAQLRAGVRHNLASNDDSNGIAEETQFTAGIGLAPFGARLDIGALYSDADLGASLELGVAF